MTNLSENKDDKKSWGSGGFFGERVLGSLALILTTPAVCLLFWYICYKQEGSLLNLLHHVQTVGVFQFVYGEYPTPFNPEAWKVILGFMGFELALMRLVPGKVFKATVTPSGHQPIYNANGFQCYFITVLAVFAVAYTGFFNPARVYDLLGDMLSSLNIFALVFCSFLVVKGLNFPSTKDSGTNGSLIVDFFWGTELYPRILGWDVKQFTNCRFGMMFWQVAVICYGFKQYELFGFVSSSIAVSIILQTVYIAKFFWWETGYFCSMDIQHDRAGYYICWGCLVWVPSMYTMHTYFMVNHPVKLSLPTALFMLVGGLYCIWMNYDCDR
jgi:7-dehydrocholesterol reductase